MKLLGIDFGTKRVGLAIGDTDSKVAVPLEVLLFDERFWDELVRLIQKEEIEGIVVGLPQTLRGEEGKIAEAVREFMGELKTRVSVPVYEEDERMSSKMADRFPEAAKKDRDAVAAAIILQSHLDRL